MNESNSKEGLTLFEELNNDMKPAFHSPFKGDKDLLVQSITEALEKINELRPARSQGSGYLGDTATRAEGPDYSKARDAKLGHTDLG